MQYRNDFGKRKISKEKGVVIKIKNSVAFLHIRKYHNFLTFYKGFQHSESNECWHVTFYCIFFYLHSLSVYIIIYIYVIPNDNVIASPRVLTTHAVPLIESHQSFDTCIQISGRIISWQGCVLLVIRWLIYLLLWPPLQYRVFTLHLLLAQLFRAWALLQTNLELYLICTYCIFTEVGIPFSRLICFAILPCLSPSGSACWSLCSNLSTCACCFM